MSITSRAILAFHLFKSQRLSDKSTTQYDNLWRWAEPLVLAFVFWLLYTSRALSFETDYPYALFVISGVLTWQCLIDAMNIPMSDLKKFKNISDQMALSPVTISTYFVIEAMHRAAFKIIAVVVFVGVFFSPNAFGLLTYCFFVVLGVILFSGLGMLFSLYNFIYADVSKFINLLLRPLIFISGVLFPIDSSPLLVEINQYNPFFIFISAARDILFFSDLTMEYTTIAYLFGILLVLAVYGANTFTRGFSRAVGN